MRTDTRISVVKLDRCAPDLLREVAAVELAAWGEEGCEENLGPRVERLQRQIERSHSEVLAVFLAYVDGRVAGVGRVKRTPEDPDGWMCFGLAVHPERRRMGVGRAILEARLAFARTNGALSIRSWSHRDNAMSVAFHRAVGYGRGIPVFAADGDKLYEFRMPL